MGDSWGLLNKALALGLLFWLSACSGQRNAEGPVGKVVRGDLIQRVTIAGVVYPNRKTVISAPYNGYVRKLYVKIGSSVRESDPIVSVSQSLRGSNEEVFPLRAPFAGTVVQVLKNEGEYVDQSSSQANSLVRIDDLSQIFIDASAPEVEVGKLKIGQEAMIRASAILNRSYHGKIDVISLAAKEQRDWDKSRVEFPVTIRLQDADAQIRPGMSVIIDIVAQKLTHVLTLRHEFIRKDGDKYYVLTQKGQRKDIQIGLQNEEVFEIRGGVEEGEVIRQSDFLSILKDQ